MRRQPPTSETTGAGPDASPGVPEPRAGADLRTTNHSRDHVSPGHVSPGHLSGSRGRPVRRRISRTAQLLATVLAVLGTAQSCLLSPPPTIEDPSAERPNVNVNQVYPPVYQILSVTRASSKVDFTVPYTSVDGGEPIWVYLWVNWNLENQRLASFRQFPPDSGAPEGMGGAGQLERTLQFSWVPDIFIQPGCNQLTLFVVHEGDADINGSRPRDFNKAAVVTWWVNVDSTGDGQTLVNCPRPSVSVTEAAGFSE